MIKYQTINLFLALTLFVACKGQVKTKPSKELSTEITFQSLKEKRPGIGLACNVHCGLQDRKGNLWFGTTGDGVYRIKGNTFKKFSTKEGLTSNTIWSVLEDSKGNIWFGTDSGLCRYDGKATAFFPIVVTGGDYSKILKPNQATGKRAVWSIMQDRSGVLWFGTTDGIYRLNGTRFWRFLDDRNIANESGLQLKMVQCMLEDKKGNIWFGSGLGEKEGLCRFDGENLTKFKPNGDDWIRSLYEDKDGTLWVACRHNGLSRYDGKSFSIVGEGEGFNNTGTGSIARDKRGNLWFASLGAKEDGGVWRFDGKSFTNFNTSNGLSNNSVFCIVADEAGNIWFGTGNSGLNRYDGKTISRVL